MGELMVREAVQKKKTNQAVLLGLAGFLTIILIGWFALGGGKSDKKSSAPINNTNLGKITQKLVYIQRPGGFFKFQYDLESGIAIGPKLVICTRETLAFYQKGQYDNLYECILPISELEVSAKPFTFGKEIALLVPRNNQDQFTHYVDLNSAIAPIDKAEAWLVFVDQGNIFRIIKGQVAYADVEDDHKRQWLFVTYESLRLYRKVYQRQTTGAERETYLGGAVVDPMGNFIGIVTGPNNLSDYTANIMTAAEIKNMLSSLNIFFGDESYNIPGKIIMK